MIHQLQAMPVVEQRSVRLIPLQILSASQQRHRQFLLVVKAIQLRQGILSGESLINSASQWISYVAGTIFAIILSTQDKNLTINGGTAKQTTNTGTISTTTASAGSYTVASGDSVWSVANKHGITMDQLRNWNNIKNDFIYPWSTLSRKKWYWVKKSGQQDYSNKFCNQCW